MDSKGSGTRSDLGQHLNALTGLRFLAALAVFVHHLRAVYPSLAVGVPIGDYAVSFFFVLSGFILTYVYAGKLTRRTIGAFYIRRFARIWPLHLVTLLIAISISFGFRHTLKIPALLFSNLFLVQTWIPRYNYIFSFNAVSWSISTEMFFYAMFPFLILGGPKKFAAKFAGIFALTVVCISVLQYADWHWQIPEKIALISIPHTNPLMRLSEFCVGIGCGYLFLHFHSMRGQTAPQPATSAFSIYLQHLAWSVGDVVVLAVLLWFWPMQLYKMLLGFYQPDSAATMVREWIRFSGSFWIFAIAIPYFAFSGGLIAKVLGCRACVYLGEISFAFYMVHQLVLRYLMRLDFDASRLTETGFVISSLVVSLCFSSMLFHLVEMPFRSAIVALCQRRWRDASRPIRHAILAAVRSPVQFASITALFVTSVYLHGCLFDNHNENYVELVRLQSDDQFRDIQLDPDTRLLGITTKRAERGVEIEFAWQTTDRCRAIRVVRLVDQQGREVRRRALPLKSLSRGKNAKFLDRIFVDDSQLKIESAAAVSLEFHSVHLRKLAEADPSRSPHQTMEILSLEPAIEISAKKQNGMK